MRISLIRLRRMAMPVELAWLWLRHQPESPLSTWFVRGSGA
jgi:hypothetical protein